jgi:14-3-3 protein epsilon
MKSFSHSDYFLLSTLSHQTERYPDLLFFLGHFLETSSELSIEERTLVSTAYKNVVGNKRAELRVLQAIEQKELRKGNENNQIFIKIYREKIEKELRDLCEEV